MSGLKRNTTDTWHRVAGDLSPLAATLKDQPGSPIDLTGKTVVFRLVRDSDGVVVVDDAAAVVVDAALARVKYVPTGTQMDLSAEAVLAEQPSEMLTYYWKIKETGQQDIRLPYDAARRKLCLHVESDS